MSPEDKCKNILDDALSEIDYIKGTHCCDPIEFSDLDDLVSIIVEGLKDIKGDVRHG